MSRDEENSWDEPREEEERDEVCYYCQSHLSGNIPQKLAGTGTLNSDRLESCVTHVLISDSEILTIHKLACGMDIWEI